MAQARQYAAVMGHPMHAKVFLKALLAASLASAGLVQAQAPNLMPLGGATPSRAKPCVAMHALPLEQSLLIAPAAMGEAAARQSLDAAAQAQAVNAGDLAQALTAAKALAEQGEWNEAKSRAVAAEGFAACAQRIYGDGAQARIAACEFDLSTLPVILLYRVDGQSRAAAAADLKRAGGLDDGGEQARRAPLMLSFTYQGAGPVVGQSRAWIDRRVADWTEQCLAGRLLLPK